MDRELVLAVLIALFCGSALTLSGSWLAAGGAIFDDPACERRAWRRLWMPFTPSLIICAALAGWALQEPANAERVPTILLWFALAFTGIWARAAWRAVRSLNWRGEDVAAATIGLWRPRIVISERIIEALDAGALAAAVEHERAHARHRDPLRIWMAQIATDLFWPWPAAHSRLVFWRQTLECARDDEARRAGTSGPDLAAAILASVRLSRASASSAMAMLCGDEAFLKLRVARLLKPLKPDAPQPHPASLWRTVPPIVGIGLAVMAGSDFGERLVRLLFRLV